MDSSVPNCVQQTKSLARHARNIFIIALIICGVLALDLAFLRAKAGGRTAGLQSCFGPLLLWSLTAVAYAFHALARANARLMDSLRYKLTSDRMKGLRQLAAIKARLRQPDPRTEGQ